MSHHAPRPAGATAPWEEALDPREQAVLRRAEEVAERMLAPRAAEVDALRTLPRSHLDALADAGLYGLHGPREAGGLEASAELSWQVTERLVAACAATAFTWLQHHSPLRLVAGAGTARTRRLLPQLCAGTVRAGVAFSYLRRAGPPAVVASPTTAGWRLDGHAPWVTGLGGGTPGTSEAADGPLVDVLAVGAVLEDDRALFALVDAGAPGLTPEPLDLSVLAATRTVALRLEDVRVTTDDLLLVEPLVRWRRRDARGAAAPKPVASATVRAAVDLLRADDRPEATAAAAALTEELTAVRSAARSAADQADGGADLDGLHAARAWLTELAVRAAHAAVAARGGRAMAASDPAGRLVREAAFWTIQAQTTNGRSAALRRTTAISRCATKR